MLVDEQGPTTAANGSHRSGSRRPATKKRRVRIPAETCSQDFGFLERRHPYGVLPGGNRFLYSTVTTSGSKETTAFVSPSDLLPDDESWVSILGFLDGVSLGRVACSCRYFYVAGHQPELWRDLVLRQASNGSVSKVGPTWKDTFAQQSHPNQAPHQPIQVDGVFSDYFYRLHSCRSFAIPDSWLDRSTDSLTTIPVSDITESMFKEFEHGNTPVLIKGAAKKWQAFEQWQKKDYLLQHSTGRTFRATSGAAPLPANFTLSAYMDYCCKSEYLEEAPLYLFDRTALQPDSELWKDYIHQLQQFTPFWDPTRTADNGHDLFNVLGEGRRPDHTWLIAGPKRSGSVFHIDPNCTHAWNAAISGRKRWIFYPPGVTPPGVYPSYDGDEVTLPLSIGEWLFGFWNAHVERKRTALPLERPLECTAMPGDILFVPHGWWHMVINLDEGLNVAVTHNYVSERNLANVLRFLQGKRHQVSGCRDRAESVKPDQLYEAFVEALKNKHPKMLETAQRVSHWTCKAWKDSPTQPTVPDESQPNIMEKAKDDSTSFSFSFF